MAWLRHYSPLTHSAVHSSLYSVHSYLQTSLLCFKVEKLASWKEGAMTAHTVLWHWSSQVRWRHPDSGICKPSMYPVITVVTDIILFLSVLLTRFPPYTCIRTLVMEWIHLWSCQLCDSWNMPWQPQRAIQVCKPKTEAILSWQVSWCTCTLISGVGVWPSLSAAPLAIHRCLFPAVFYVQCHAQ